MKSDVIVIGAGVVGSSVARELSRYNLNVTVLEAGSDVAEGASKANSAIVHAGFDAKPGTNKAKFNVLGNRMFEDLCRELRVPFRRNGSLVLAFGADEEKSLDELAARAAQNGVPVEIVGRDELRRREPNVSPEATAALWAPTGGICCPYELTFRLAENAAANGVTFAFDKRVQGLKFKVQSLTWRVDCSDGREYEAKAVVNCAGIHSDEINNLVSATKYAIEARRGEYLMLDKDEDGTFSATMFQVPSKMGKGILVSPTVDGTVIVGPTAEDVPDKEDRATTYAGLEKVKALARRTYPNLPLDKVITEFSGLRAHETTVQDFILGEAPDAPNFFNAVGIESPGLTSAPAIGVWLAERVAEKLGASRKNPALISKDVSWWPKTREMAPEALAELVERDPSFGRVICRCEGVTEGEIRAAIRARVGARTLDGVKRRTRSGMGRCQGGFCTPRLIEILGAELGLPPEAFLKSRKTAPKALRDGTGSRGEDAAPTVLDVVVIGAGPAGLAAACAAKDEGAENVLVLERDDAPGGILQQCIHNGFGLHRFQEELTGPEYAQRYVDLANEKGVQIRCGTMVLKVESSRFKVQSGGGVSGAIEVTAMSPRGGLKVYRTKAVVLAMGCRERPRGALMTPGTRPAGVYTAGTVQRLVNMDGIMPGKRVVILGSGDIGLIMARRLTFSGAKVLACVEIMKKSSGLMRNVVQCLDDYDIPLLLSHTVTDVEGREHVTGVKVSRVDESLKPVPGTEMHFDCDTLVLSCGLIPENELTKKAGVEMDPKTRGPKVDPKTMATSVPGIFAGGNVVRVYDLVDWVSRDSALAGKSAAAYAAAR